MHQHPGLAATGASQHQRAPRRCGDCITLGIVEIIENIGDIHQGILTVDGRHLDPKSLSENRTPTAETPFWPFFPLIFVE